ncbi:MAG: flavin reductase [Rhizobiales bacterium]|nr:flavin reductase [Hyphomicrobiales bacterium]MBA70680.1 flavin reductase [Hyphomicrobiales bacterium]|tara:strand:+ start:232 stop:726 length:495 start_codon:yes stop_codon:yes gene_type:complete
MTNIELFRNAMQRLAAPAVAITTSVNGRPAGLIATSVCSLSTEPPSMLVCVNRTATAHDDILTQKVIGISLFPEDAEEDARHFAMTRGEDRFSRGGWSEGAGGVPLFDRAPFAFACRIARCFDGYSHTILVADVVDTRLGEEASERCLLWHKQTFTTLAPPKVA